MKRLLLLLLTFATVANAQTVDDVVAGYFKAVGGKDRWVNLQTRVDHMHSQAYDGLYGQPLVEKNQVIVKLAKRQTGTIVWDRFTAFSVTNPMDSFVTCYNGERYWSRINDGEPIVYEDYTQHYGQFANLGHSDCMLKADSLYYIGIERVDDFSCYVLGVVESGIENYYYFDQQTNLLIQSHMKGQTKLTKYSDYRAVDGFMIPFMEALYDGKRLETQYRLEKVELNLLVDDDRFKFLP